MMTVLGSCPVRLSVEIVRPMCTSRTNSDSARCRVTVVSASRSASVSSGIFRR